MLTLKVQSLLETTLCVYFLPSFLLFFPSIPSLFPYFFLLKKIINFFSVTKYKLHILYKCIYMDNIDTTHDTSIEYRDKWVLINAYFYKFWMLHSDFIKYNIIDAHKSR